MTRRRSKSIRSIARATKPREVLVPKKRVRYVELSPLELAALAHLARGLRLAGVAERMELSSIRCAFICGGP